MKIQSPHKVALSLMMLAVCAFQVNNTYAQERCNSDPFLDGSINTAKYNKGQLGSVKYRKTQQSTIKGAYKKNGSVLSRALKFDKSKYVKNSSMTAIIGQQGDVVLTDATGQPRKLFDSKGQTVQINNGDNIQTADQSAISLQTSDGSRLLIPSNSSVSLTQVSRTPIQISLKQGRIENYVNKSSHDNTSQNNKGKTSYQIRTPAVTLSVRGTQFRVEHESSSNTTLASVSEGLVVAQKIGECAAPSALPAGSGLVAAPKNMTVTSILPAPDLSDFPIVIRGNTLHARIKPIEKAVRYHAQAGYDEGLLLFAQESYSNTPEISLTGLDSGYYFVKLTAIDADGNEGLANTVNVLYQPNANAR